MILLSLTWITSASAGSIAAPGIAAGPDVSAAHTGPAAVNFNPAALAATEGFQAIIDGQGAWVRIDATATRNDGIDPNTGEPYDLATARVVAPVALIGVSYQAIPDRLTVGLSLNNPFTGGADYLSGEENPETGPYTGHQRYHGIKTTIVSAAVTPAVGVTVVDGLHVGAGVSWLYDYISVLKASRITDDEGAPDYSSDVLLDGAATGSHWGWNAGVFFDKYDKAQVGISYASAGEFNASTGTAEVTVPEGLTSPTVAGGLVVPATVAIDLELPAVLRAYVNSQLNDKLNIGFGWEYQMWYACCNGEDADIHTELLSEDGDPIGQDDGVAIAISEDIYSPRRLWNASTFAVLGGHNLSEKAWLGWNLRYNQNAVPDYAVSATNLDFANAGGQLGFRYKLTDAVTAGLTYSKFLLFTREITDSAWNLGDGNERFSPSVPAVSSGNGTYSGAVDIFGFRLGVAL